MGSAGPQELDYRIIRMPLYAPDRSDYVKYAAKFQNTKIAALRQSPSEWIYQYEAEAIHPLTLWEERLQRDNTVLACIAAHNPTMSDEDALEEYYATPEMGQVIPALPEDETRWHFYDLYTFPTHRGRGIARNLILASLDVTKEATRVLKENNRRIARVRLICNPKNPALVETYQRMGFARNGMITLEEGLQANGMAESVPARSALGEQDFKIKFGARIGVIMERSLDVVHDT